MSSAILGHFQESDGLYSVFALLINFVFSSFTFFFFPCLFCLSLPHSFLPLFQSLGHFYTFCSSSPNFVYFFFLLFLFIILIISVHLWPLIIPPPSCLSFFLPSILHSILLVLVPFLLLSFVHYLPSVLHFCLLSFFFFSPHFPRDFPESPAEHFCYFVALKKGWC